MTINCSNSCGRQITSYEDGIDCTQCYRWFCDSCYDTCLGDGCHCHIMICEVWEDPEDNSIAVFKQSQKEQQKKLLSTQARFVRTITGNSWKEIMTKHHELMGWEPYQDPYQDKPVQNTTSWWRTVIESIIKGARKRLSN